MGAVDLVVQVEAPPSVASGLQRVGRAGHQVGAVSRGVVFPKYRGDLVSCAVVAERMTAGAIESLRYPRNPLDVLAQHVVAMVALDPWTVGDARGGGAAGRAVRGAAGLRAARRAGHAGGAVPVGGVRRAAGADHLGPGHGRAARPPGRAAAGGHLRRHHPGPRAVHRHHAGRGGRPRLAGRRAGRGDGVRVAGRRHVPARHVELAGRGHHARPRDRHPGARGARADAVLEGRVDRAAARAGPGGRRLRPGDGGAGRRRRPRPGHRRRARRVGGGQPARRTCASSARPPGTCPATGRSSSSGSGTSWATGGSWCTPRSVPRSTGRGRWRSPRGCGSGAGWRCTPPGADDGIVLRLPDAVDDTGAEVVPTAEDVLLDPARGRADRRRASSAARRCTRRGSGSARRGRCCCPAATRSGGRRCGSSARSPRSCWRWPGSTSSSR